LRKGRREIGRRGGEGKRKDHIPLTKILDLPLKNKTTVGLAAG